MALPAFLFAALPAIHAAGDGKEPVVSIYCAAYADGLKSVFVKSAEDRYHGVSLSTANIVETADPLIEDGSILLYGPAGEDGKHPVVAKAEIGGIRQPLLVLHPAGKDGQTAYDSKAVEMASGVFPLGGYSLVNLSPTPVRIIHGEVVIELDSTDCRVFTPAQAAGQPLAVRMDYKAGESWVQLSSAPWAVRTDRRTLVCFLLDAASKRMNVKSVPLRGDPSR
ncbi:hypothetical protein HZ994_16900 [Akkermansiaceae bacterium]|nr:hypothetical protein HZ994_16900 [Akkermansiaceae bacterium]